MVWGLLTILLGVAYGYFTPGRQDKRELFKTAALIALAIGLVLAVIGWMLNTNPLGVGEGLLGLVISVIVTAALFVLGAWIGDWLEGAPKRA